jgi:hypothetical protein
LLTLDKGIANPQEYPPGNFPGIVLFRPEASGRGAVLNFIRDRLADVLGLDLTGRLIVVGAFPNSNSVRTPISRRFILSHPGTPIRTRTASLRI